MNKSFLAILTMMISSVSTPAMAGGINTNSNMSVTFDRMLSRDGTIGIDGVYFNPAGVAFMSQGSHLSLNWQLIYQSRTIDNTYPLFAKNTEFQQAADPTKRKFRGKAFVPLFPSFQYAYNWKDFSFQAGFGVGGGGGKCTFDDGLGSFEKIVSETALAATGLAQTVDAVLGQTIGAPGTKLFSSDNIFGTSGNYSEHSYMRGNQYYFGLQVGAAYKITPNLSVYGGVRGVYALCNYYGYVRDITVGNMPLYQVLDPTKPTSANIELSCDQTGIGFTPIVGIDYKLGRWNFAAKYEFKTRMRLKNKAVNQFPSIGNLSDNLGRTITSALTSQYTNALVQQGVDPTLAQAQAMIQAQTVSDQVLSNAQVTGTMEALKSKFDEGLDEATGEYQDGKKIAADLPAILAAGVSFEALDNLRFAAGFHYYYDMQASSYKHRENKLDRGTIEYSFGAEYDPCKLITVSAGFQRTSYGLNNDYMDDKSFVTSSRSVGGGVAIHLSKKMKLNVAYFHTFYSNKKTSEQVALTENFTPTYEADYTRTNNVFGAGLDIDF